MILILSEHEDNITDKVCAYLNYYKASYLRINKQESENIINHILFTNGKIEIKFSINEKEYYLNDFKSIWCRRGRFQSSFYHSKNTSFESEIKNHFEGEKLNFLNFIYHYIADNTNVKVLNNPLRYEVNKLQSLFIAQKQGLIIPPTIITNDKPNKKKFPFKHIITKTIQNGLIGLKNGEYIKNTGTIRLSNNDIKGSFFYSKFQKEIEKKYELRIFYLNGLFYSLAYFIYQKDEVDSRKLNDKNVKYIPFNLPDEIKNKLTGFMEEMKLESGSIDMII
ncbi:MAG: hypothetical protein KDK36_05985, partial [Leptospiraceae bacterium]|nr:hypothetical protein [Leptospiraceae bacterium]